MNREEVFEDLEYIRASVELKWGGRIASYIEANIDEFMEAYEEEVS